MMQEMWIPLRSRLLDSNGVLWKSLYQSRKCASLSLGTQSQSYFRSPTSRSFVPSISKCDTRSFYSSYNAPHCLLWPNSSSEWHQRQLPNCHTFSSAALHTSTGLDLKLFQSVHNETSYANKINLELFNHELSTHNQLRFLHRHSGRRRVGRTFSSQKDSTTPDKNNEMKDEKDVAETDVDADKKLTVYQRFKKTYKEHGKVLVVVHLLTSAVWFGTFYTVARCGVDMVPLLESWNLSEKLISPFRSGGLGDAALAYLMYKLATPARYTVTLTGTNLVIRNLKKKGKIQQVPKEDSLRELYKDGKEDLKSKSSNTRHRLRHMRHRIQGRIRSVRRRHPRDRRNH